MTRPIEGLWAVYAREQSAVRRRELNELTDVSGDEALDFIINAVQDDKPFTTLEVRRSRLTAARRERSQRAIRARNAVAFESDLIYRSGVNAEISALIAVSVRAMSNNISSVMSLDAQGYTDQEAGSRLGLSASTVRQRISRATRRMVS